MTGYGAPPTVRERLRRGRDAGHRLAAGEITTYGWSIPAAGTRWAHVDIAPGRSRTSIAPAAITITSDALFLRAAVARLESRGVLDAAGADARSARNAEDRAAWEDATVIDGHPWSGPGVHPGKVVTLLRQLLPDDAIVTTDAGSFGTWAARGFRFRRPGTFLGSTSGAMGYGLPAAIAAAWSTATGRGGALVGDGGLGMTLAEIETAVRNGLRTVIVVFDNQRYGMIRTLPGPATGRRGGRDGPRTDRLRGGGAGARGTGASRWRTTPRSSRRFARRSSPIGPTVVHPVWTGAGKASTAGHDRDPRSVRGPGASAGRPATTDPGGLRGAGRAAHPDLVRRPRPRRDARAQRGLGDPQGRGPPAGLRRCARPHDRADDARPPGGNDPGPAFLDRARWAMPPGRPWARAGLRHLRGMVDRRDRAARPRLPDWLRDRPEGEAIRAGDRAPARSCDAHEEPAPRARIAAGTRARRLADLRRFGG